MKPIVTKLIEENEVTPPVTQKRIDIARQTLDNVDAAAKACRTAELPFFVACALLEQESKGKNVWGGDANSVNVGLHNKGVTQREFMKFLFKVVNGGIPNGVGPCQITYAGKVVGGHRDGGHFRIMAEQGLLPWSPHDNMVYGFSLFANSHRDGESWGETYARYNGGEKPNATAIARGKEFDKLVKSWMSKLKIG